jgi:hypothetical protein
MIRKRTCVKRRAVQGCRFSATLSLQLLLAKFFLNPNNTHRLVWKVLSVRKYTDEMRMNQTLTPLPKKKNKETEDLMTSGLAFSTPQKAESYLAHGSRCHFRLELLHNTVSRQATISKVMA